MTTAALDWNVNVDVRPESPASHDHMSTSQMSIPSFTVEVSPPIKGHVTVTFGFLKETWVFGELESGRVHIPAMTKCVIDNQPHMGVDVEVWQQGNTAEACTNIGIEQYSNDISTGIQHLSHRFFVEHGQSLIALSTEQTLENSFVQRTVTLTKNINDQAQISPGANETMESCLAQIRRNEHDINMCRSVAEQQMMKRKRMAQSIVGPKAFPFLEGGFGEMPAGDPTSGILRSIDTTQQHALLSMIAQKNGHLHMDKLFNALITVYEKQEASMAMGVALTPLQMRDVRNDMLRIFVSVSPYTFDTSFQDCVLNDGRVTTLRGASGEQQQWCSKKGYANTVAQMLWIDKQQCKGSIMFEYPRNTTRPALQAWTGVVTRATIPTLVEKIQKDAQMALRHGAKYTPQASTLKQLVGGVVEFEDCEDGGIKNVVCKLYADSFDSVEKATKFVAECNATGLWPIEYGEPHVQRAMADILMQSTTSRPVDEKYVFCAGAAGAPNMQVDQENMKNANVSASHIQTGPPNTHMKKIASSTLSKCSQYYKRICDGCFAGHAYAGKLNAEKEMENKNWTLWKITENSFRHIEGTSPVQQISASDPYVLLTQTLPSPTDNHQHSTKSCAGQTNTVIVTESQARNAVNAQVASMLSAARGSKDGVVQCPLDAVNSKERFYKMTADTSMGQMICVNQSEQAKETNVLVRLKKYGAPIYPHDGDSYHAYILQQKMTNPKEITAMDIVCTAMKRRMLTHEDRVTQLRLADDVYQIPRGDRGHFDMSNSKYSVFTCKRLTPHGTSWATEKKARHDFYRAAYQNMAQKYQWPDLKPKQISAGIMNLSTGLYLMQLPGIPFHKC